MKPRLSLLSPLLLACPLASGPAWADVVLPSILSNHMVLQKTSKARIWGKADPCEEVSVTIDKLNGKAAAGPDGKWELQLDLSQSQPGPFEMVVQGKNRLAIADVLVGEVWVASGQSNMEFPIKGWGNVIGADAEIAGSSNPMLRQFLVPRVPSFELQDQCKGSWIVATPETVGQFTAVGYYFGKRLQKELQTPVGILNSSWGGTPVEAWTSREALDTVPDLKAAGERKTKDFNEYPAKKAAYMADFGKWIADNAREDRPTQDVAAYAGVAVSSEGWTKVTIPGSVAAPGLPASGVFWLRREIPIESKQVGKPLSVTLVFSEGVESIYWNGQLIKTSTVNDFNGKDAERYSTVPAELVKEGKGVLAMRIYAPVAAPKFIGLRVGDHPWIAGECLVKAELELPALDAAQAAAAPVAPLARLGQQYISGSLFGGMIQPIIPYAIRGAIWYQGESNADRAWQYRTTFALMIQDWRSRWNLGDFPFYFCQLANFSGKTANPEEAGWAELRDAQSATLKLPHTGQAVLIDLGESDDIHPRNKQDVGNRLALIALARDYGQKIPYSGPVYASMKTDKGQVRLSFAHLEGGLVAQPVPETFVKSSLHNETAPLVRNSPQSELEGFAICGEDKKWVWADAKIDGDDVVVWSEQVPAPVAVRYGWSINPTCNLYNKAGLPASPFRTDDFPAATLNSKY